MSMFLVEIRDRVSGTTFFVLFRFSCEILLHHVNEAWLAIIARRIVQLNHLTSGFTFRR